MKEPVIVVHPAANPNVRADLRALERAGCLAAFCTTLALPFGGLLRRTSPRGLRQQLSRRIFEETAASKIVTSPLRELVRLVASRAGLSSLTRHETGWASVDAVYRALDDRVAQHLETGKVRAAAVYAYEDGALKTFKTARGLGLRRLYHLPIAYWRVVRELMLEERDRWPDWAPTMGGLADSLSKYQRKDLELADADCVIVASSFTRRSLGRCPEPPNRIEVVPYGAPPPVDVRRPRVDDPRRPLRALFVGHLSQLKGLADLQATMKQVGGLVTLTLVGPRTTQDCPAVDQTIQSHRWIPPVPHARVLELMAEHDVLVLPSVVDGFGLVVTEALSRGLPVIATSNTGAADLMTDGRDGFVVPIRSPDTIAERLTQLAEDRDLLARMSLAALETARRNPWRRYEERIVQILAEELRHQS